MSGKAVWWIISVSLFYYVFLKCLMLLAKKLVSIVTEYEGTTRDLINFDANLNGIPIRLIDSAGIRETNCKIEALGVELAKKA